MNVNKKIEKFNKKFASLENSFLCVRTFLPWDFLEVGDQMLITLSRWHFNDVINLFLACTDTWGEAEEIAVRVCFIKYSQRPAYTWTFFEIYICKIKRKKPKRKVFSWYGLEFTCWKREVGWGLMNELTCLIKPP